MISFVSSSVQVVGLGVSLLFQTLVGDFAGALRTLLYSLLSLVLFVDTLSVSESNGEGGFDVVAVSVEHDESDPTKDAADNDDDDDG